MQLIIKIMCVILIYPVTAHAYVGPGLGLGVLGAIIGMLFSIILAIIGIFWYPLKRLLGKGRKKTNANNAE